MSILVPISRRKQLVQFGLLAWAALVISQYYRKLWQIFPLGLRAWVGDNYSLSVLHRSLASLLAAPQAILRLPFFSEAMARDASAVLGAVLVLLAVQVSGTLLLRLLSFRFENWREALLYQSAIGFGVVSNLSLCLSELGIYYPVTVRILLAIVLLAGLVWYIRQLYRFGFFKLEREREGAHKRKTDRIWKILLFSGLLVGLAGALAPEIEFDALWYHLWLPKLWLQHGQPVDVISEYVSLYPLSWELIYGAGLVTGGSITAKLLHFACLPLTALLVYQLARRFFPQISAWFATALFVLAPTVLWEATTAYIDLALAFYVGLALYGLLAYAERREKQWLILAGITLGLALATKHLALIVLLLAVSALVIFSWRERRTLRGSIGSIALLVGISLMFPLPWYLRSWFASGNPFFPELYSIFGAFPAERWNALSEAGLAHFQAHFGDPRTLKNLLLLPWNATVHSARYGGTFGPLFLLLLPALALPGRSRWAGWLLGFVAGYMVFWSSPLSSFQLRFLVPIVPALAVLAAEAFYRLETSLGAYPRVRIFAVALVALLLVLNLPPFISLHERDRVKWDGWLTHVLYRVPSGVVLGSESEEGYLSARVPSFAAWRYINKHLPQEARILTFSGGDQFYAERSRISNDATLAGQAVWRAVRGEEARALREMRRLGISYILFDKRQLEAGELSELALAQPDVISEWYEKAYEDGRFLLYRIRWEKDRLPLEAPAGAGLMREQPRRVRLGILLVLLCSLGTLAFLGRISHALAASPLLERLLGARAWRSG